MPRREMTIEEREEKARDRIVPRGVVIQCIDLSESEIDRVIDSLYEDVIVKAKYSEKNGRLIIKPGRQASEFTMREYICLYFYEHHKGELGRKKAEEIVSIAIMPEIEKRAVDLLKKRSDAGARHYYENGQPNPDLLDDLKQEAWLVAQTELRFKYDPVNNEAKLTTYIFNNIIYAMVKFLGDMDNISMKDNQALGQMKEMDDYLAGKGMTEKRPADYVFAAKVLGFNGWTEKKAERLLKERKRAVFESIEDLPISVNQNIEEVVIKDERAKMINTILDQIGEYDRFAKWALLAFQEYSPPPGTEKRDSDTKGRMKHIKDYFVKHYYPKERYGEITVKTFTRLLQIAYDEFRYRSELMNFFKRDTADGDVYGLNLDYDDTLQSYMEDIETTIEEYNENDFDYEFDRKYIP